MSHKGKMVPWTCGLHGIAKLIIGGPYVSDENATVSGSGILCDACGAWAYSVDGITLRAAAQHCRRLCSHCLRDENQHADGCCLFAPTRFEPAVYTARTEAVW